MKNIYLLLLFFISTLSFGQLNTNYAIVDAKMIAIPSNASASTETIANYINTYFKTENDKIRAAFFWTASNISYDVKNMFAQNSDETSQEKITTTLKLRKGVCIHYAEVFNDIANKIGIQSHIIVGYTQQNRIISTLSHAWCAAKIDSKWYVFDPTWGAGFVKNGIFVKKLNNYYFKTEPEKSIASHIPFDYLWQFLNYPITNQEFYDGKIQINKSKPFFNFEKEIEKTLSLSESDKIWESRKRIEKNGVKNQLIQEYLNSRKKEQEVVNHNLNVEKINTITDEYNQAIALFNDFIYYKNNKFKPILADYEINKMIQNPKDNLVNCQNNLDNLAAVGSGNSANLASLRKSIYDALTQVEKQELFVKDYLSKSKIARKSMFSKVTWFGIPLN
ncbi:transglutaminase domain-containing protein [Flavobacterium cellulosilyticum]|uniref:Transglutaminase-like domain-containing protein n=1 Tax=Flavobacterium cellulosilyticum TaxID=2541731 RepID=A0A4R5CE49_9FLAO|nr:transglutaminase domain-containing protein [Flavobacterium cellulosilyticum]TDD96610.1 hypothetical protein E0F76_11435 [Flavobacterium cellulosilyticum]